MMTMDMRFVESLLKLAKECELAQAIAEDASLGVQIMETASALLAERDGLVGRLKIMEEALVCAAKDANATRDSAAETLSALRAENERLKAALQTVAVFVNTDKYAARENVLAYIRAALNP